MCACRHRHAASVLGSLDAVAATSRLPQPPWVLPQGAGRLGLFKATVNAIPPVVRRTPCANSLVTLLSCLLFASTLGWIWGGQLACDWDNRPASSADSDGLNISPH